MSSTQRVFRHTAVQVISRAIGTLLGLIAVGVMTRHLGTDGYGAYTTVTAYLGFFAIMVDFGISTTLVAMLAEKGADEVRLSRNAFGLRLVSTVAVMAIAALIALLLPYSQEIKNGIAILTVSFVFVALNQIFTSVYQRHVQMHWPAIAEIAGRIVLVAGVLAAAAWTTGLFWILLAVIVANMLTAALAGLFLTRLTPVRPAFDWETWKHILIRAWPVGVSIVFTLIYLRADTVLLSLMREQSEVGLYGAAYRVIDVLTILPMMFMGIVLPFLSAAWSSNDRERFTRVLRRAFDALALGVIPLVAGAVVMGPALLAFVAGEPFRVSGVVLGILIFGVAGIFLGAAFTHAIVAQNSQKKILPFLAIDALLSLVLYIVLIPRFGMWAAAWITVLSETFAAVAAWRVAVTTSGRNVSLKIALRAVAAALAMALVDIPFSDLHVLIRIMIGSVSYLGFALLFRAVTPAMIREVLAFRRTPAQAASNRA